MNILAHMSATILHTGHIRLLKYAANIGKVIVGLNSDENILRYKGFVSPLNFHQRCEILESVKYVERVIPVPHIITDKILDYLDCQYLIHGREPSQYMVEKGTEPISKSRLIIIPRTPDVSSRNLWINYKENRGKLSRKIKHF